MPAPRWPAWPFALISALLGSQILIGYPQYVWIGLLAGVPYAAACLFRSLSENRLGEGDSPILLRGLRKIGTVPGSFGCALKVRRAGGRFVSLAVAALVGVLLGAVQLADGRCLADSTRQSSMPRSPPAARSIL